LFFCSAYITFQGFTSLNAAEKALLCSRLALPAYRLPETLQHAVEVSPTSREQQDALFKLAMAANALSGACLDAHPTFCVWSAVILFVYVAIGRVGVAETNGRCCPRDATSDAFRCSSHAR
jgi:hypothetical protein